MKKVLLWIGSLMAALFMVIMLLGIMALRGLTDNQVRVESQTVLEVDVAGLLPDYDRGSISSLLSGDRLTVTSLVEGIDRAAADERIIAILLQSDLINTSWGDLRELRHSLSRFREAGKPIYCHVQITADKGYYLASIASQLWLTHSTSGGIFLRGIGFERAYLKNLAAACGIKFDVVHAGKYKGAFENLSRDNMSAPVRRNLGMLLDDISQTYLADISSTRGVETELLIGLLRQRQSLFINGAEALNLNLVDGLKSRHELESWLEETCSDSPRLDMADYLDKPRFLRKQEQIAVLHLEGIITDGGVLENPGESTISSRVFLPLLKELREEEQVLAVVLRINSPGGSASISEEIWQSARELASVKPLLVSMGGVAASGGYYIAAAGDYILAQPTTIPGSIGVVGMLTDASQLLAWGKVNYEQRSTSTYHNFGHPAFGMSRHQRGSAASAVSAAGPFFFRGR